MICSTGESADHQELEDVFMGVTNVSWDVLGEFMTRVFEKEGLPEEDAKLCADVLMESDRRGIESHGCNRFKPIYIDRIDKGILNPVTEIEILKETPTTVVLDAHDGMGMVASKKAMEICIEKAKTYGMASAAIRNSSHYGIAGYWASMAVDAGMIGITGTNARPSIAPTFGVENMLGTNPLTIGLPTDEEFPFMIDCATSTIQNGRIEYYAKIGKDVPEGTVIGRDGKPITDSKVALEYIRSKRAALSPLGGIGDKLAGYKGYGYATAIEILCAALQNGIFLRDLEGKNEDGSIRPYHLGHFFIVIDPEAFLGLDNFRKTAGEICRELRASEKAPGEERIYTAGEKEYLAWLQRKDVGAPVTDAVMKEFIGLRDRFGLTDIKFPGE